MAPPVLTRGAQLVQRREGSQPVTDAGVRLHDAPALLRKDEGEHVVSVVAQGIEVGHTKGLGITREGGSLPCLRCASSCDHPHR
jgi:hypothetical protein